MKANGVLILLLCLCVSGSLTAQLRDVPSAVTNSFKTKYPAATDVSWEDNVTLFEANFKVNGQAYRSKFSKDGKWKETEKSITINELPAPVQTAFRNSKFSAWELRTIEYVEKNDGTAQYRIFVKNKSVKRKYLYYNPQGKLIRESYKLT